MSEDDAPFEKRCRAIVCTKNNYTDHDESLLNIWGREKCNYLVYGHEVGAEGTRHLQIYFELKNAMSYAALNKALFRAWFKKRKGTPRQAAGYCKKGVESCPDGQDYSYFYSNPADSWNGNEIGEISMQGKRTDIDDAVEMIVHEGATLQEVAAANPCSWVKHSRGFRDLYFTLMKPRRLASMPEVTVLWGPTGTGKTYHAEELLYPGVPFYKWNPAQDEWWDKYEGERYIILDEFRGGMKFAHLLNLLDRYGCRMPYKGGFVEIQADKFCITSPGPPDSWYSDNDKYDRTAQLHRRITKVVEMNEPYQPPE